MSDKDDLREIAEEMGHQGHDDWANRLSRIADKGRSIPEHCTECNEVGPTSICVDCYTRPAPPAETEVAGPDQAFECKCGFRIAGVPASFSVHHFCTDAGKEVVLATGNMKPDPEPSALERAREGWRKNASVRTIVGDMLDYMEGHLV